VFDQRFRTRSGIGPESTVGELRTAIRDLRVETIDDHVLLNSKSMQMTFDIDGSSVYDEEGKLRMIIDFPAATPVISVRVY
jgi:hypothetical protein